MRISFQVDMAVRCEGCRLVMPMQRFAPTWACLDCGQAHDLETKYWPDCFERGFLAEALDWEEGDEEATEIDGTRIAEGRLKRAAPCCPACARPLREDEIEALDEWDDDQSEGWIECAGCGENIVVRRAPADVKAVFPGATFVVGELDETQAEDREPVITRCLSCMASFEVDGSERIVRCPTCDKPNTVADGLWRRLHPIPKRRAIGIVCEFTERAMRSLYMADPDNAVKYAASPELAPDEVASLVAHEDWEVRRAVAASPLLQREHVEALLKDSDSDVVEALAANPVVDAEVLRRLARHDDSDVIAAVATNPNLDESVLRALATHDDSDVRAAAAKHAKISPELLGELAKDGDYGVRVAVASNPATPTAALDAMAMAENDNDVLDALATAALSASALTRIAGVDDYDQQRLAARNPGTPTAVLWRLVNSDYGAIVHDPARAQLKRRRKAGEDVMASAPIFSRLWKPDWL